MNQLELERVINKMMELTEADLDLLLADPVTSMFDKFVAKIVKLGMDEGDEKRLEFILARMIGKVTDRLEIKTPPPVRFFDEQGNIRAEIGEEKKE